jgi:acyl-CoA thioester hydrolase
MAPTDFRYTMRFCVPYHDIDMMQHVNHTAYIIWAETIRVRYLTDLLGVGLRGKESVILAHLEFDYERPLDLGEQVVIGCRTSRLGRRSIELSYEIWRESSSERAASGLSLMVAYDYDTQKSQALPERWREAVLAYEPLAPALGSPAKSSP